MKTLIAAAVIVLVGCVWLVIFSHNIHAQYAALHTHEIAQRDNAGNIVCVVDGKFITAQEFHRLHPNSGCWVPVTGTVYDGVK